MVTHGVFRTALCVLTVHFACGVLCADPEETGGYWALFADGSEVTGSRIRDWHERERRATLSGRKLFDPRRPVRLLCHLARRPGGRGPRVFLTNGDVLPGRVSAFLPSEPGSNLPDRLVVTLGPPLLAGPRNTSRGKGGQPVAYVRADSVSRVVLGQVRPRPRLGGAVFFKDGRRQVVSSIRWTPDGLKGLSEEQIVSGRFAELEEIHVPKVDTTAGVLADAVLAGPGRDGRIGRMTTDEGAVLTYLVARRESRSERGRKVHDTFHAVQPSWSLTAVRVPEGSICLRSYRDPTEVPLSLLPCEALSERSFTGFAWPWRRNRSVRGDVLRVGSHSCDLGMGTHSYSAVAFPLPAGARSLACGVGLDRAVGGGGCVRCAVRQDTAGGRELWRSGVLIGSKAPARVGPLSLSGVRRLVFVTEFAHDGRPAGAEPCDIRDEVDWLLPMVTVDATALRLTRQWLWHYVPALRGWSVDDKAAGEVRLSMGGHSSSIEGMAMETGPKPLVLSRKVRASMTAGVLCISAVRGHHHSGHVLEVLLDGKPLKGMFGNGQPVRTRAHGPSTPVKQRYALAPHLGREVTLTLRVARDQDWRDKQVLIWQSLAIRPLVAGLPADGRMLRPDVPLTSLKPIRVIWHPQDKGKRATAAELPKPVTMTMHGVRLSDAYKIVAGMKLSYKVRPSWNRFVAVVGSEDPDHHGPFTVLLDGKEAWRSDSEAVTGGQLTQVSVAIPAGTKALSLVPEDNMTTGTWAQAGFLQE